MFGYLWKTPMKSSAAGVTFMVITAGFIYGEGQAVIHSSKAPCMIQHEICAGQAEVEFHAFDATMFATVSGPVIG